MFKLAVGRIGNLHWIASICLVVAASCGLLPQRQVWSDVPTKAADANAADVDAIAHLSQAIDRQITGAWKDQRVVAAPRCDDAEFARRAYLDLMGRIPRVSEIRRFLADSSTAKREQRSDATGLLGLRHPALHRA